MEVIVQTNYSIFHWFVLVWFIKEIIGDRQKDFTDFWTQTNGDYSYLEDSPNFLKNEYLERDLEIDDFARQNQKVVKYIEFCEKKIKEPAERNFLNYCLFNEFVSWDDCLRTKRLIEAAKK
ncbi:11143_t:CDS:2 [Cetraspora pellucida]|uniref:11143_t:CDS:1 n=1 Tax=Cetraspora pellucida TaxID=1433469 RepID=A0ACA9NUY9_9GLOM|nr:11143_t:CDS:2 [Cetraspora pellucida]